MASTVHGQGDEPAETVKGEETIRFVNSADKPFHRLALSWAAQDGRILEIKANGEDTELLAGMGPWSPREPIPFVLSEPLGPGETG